MGGTTEAGNPAGPGLPTGIGKKEGNAGSGGEACEEGNDSKERQQQEA